MANSWIFEEIKFRRLSSIFLVVIPAVIVLVWIFLTQIVTGHSIELLNALDEKDRVLKKNMHEMWDEYRKITKDLGFNVLILPKGQNLGDFYAENFSSRYMPEIYAEKLTQSGIATIEHILPSLMQKTFWQEQKRSVFVIGVRGEMKKSTNLKAKSKSPILQPVDSGNVVLGYELSHSLDYKPGDYLSFLGKKLRVAQCHERRGNKDDITIWINLSTAQELFNKKDSINAILALECRCAADENLPNLAKIRTDLEKILPQTQVIEFMSEVIARAETRYSGWKVEQVAFEKEKAFAQEQLASTKATIRMVKIVFSVILLSGITLLTLLNVRTRKKEIGILKAIGFKTSYIFWLFVSKTLILSITGVCLGGIGVIISLWVTNNYNLDFHTLLSVAYFPFIQTLIILFCLLALIVVAGTAPVITSVNKHPGDLL